MSDATVVTEYEDNTLHNNVDIFLGKDSTLQDLERAYQEQRALLLRRAVTNLGSGEPEEVGSAINVYCYSDSVYAIAGFNLGALPIEVQQQLGFMQQNKMPDMLLPGSNIPLVFQTGPRSDDGPNGITIEALLSVCLHRLTKLNVAPWNCPENDVAIGAIENALDALGARQLRRIDERVHDTNAPDSSQG